MHTWLTLFPEGTEVVVRKLATDVRMRCYERGEGEVALFLHGFPERAVSFRNQLAGLSAYARCIAPDMRGYGGTSAPSAVHAYAAKELRADILALITDLGVARVHLVGHDWGGVVAWDFAARHPERLQSLTVLNAPAAAVMGRAMRRHPAQLARSSYIAFFQLPWLPEAFFAHSPAERVARIFRGSARNAAVFTDEVLAPYAEQAARTHLHGGLNYYRAALRFSEGRPGAVTVPTKLVWGEADHALGPWFMEPELYRGVVDTLDIVRVSGSGHWVQQEKPDAVNDAILSHWRR